MTLHAGQPVTAAGAALETAAQVVILLHGRNAGPENILELVPRLDRPAVAYLAPAAAGRTWYPKSFLAPRAENEPWLSSALSLVADTLAHVTARGFRGNQIVLMGFSQGACLAAEFAIRHPLRYGGVVIFSGGCIGPPGTTWDPVGSFDGTPAFFGCSDRDAHVPQGRVEESAALFAHAGAAVTARIYPGLGHVVNDDEIGAARAILDGVSTPAASGRGR
jgi:predicted esterase